MSPEGRVCQRELAASWARSLTVVMRYTPLLRADPWLPRRVLRSARNRQTVIAVVCSVACRTDGPKEARRRLPPSKRGRDHFFALRLSHYLGTQTHIPPLSRSRPATSRSAVAT